MTIEEVNAMKDNRKEFREALVEHPGVLAWIGNELGVFSITPETADPLLLSFWNRLLYQCGIVHTYNLVEYVSAIAKTSNDRDLIAIENDMKEKA